MCGIAGFSLTPNSKIDRVALTRSLLWQIESRGRDASGAAWTEPDGSVWYHKEPTKGSRYGRYCPITPTTQTAILHTRFATSGDPADNRNNHPFTMNGVTGVHNGIVRNVRRLFEMAGVAPETDCDSEAIFALLAYGQSRPGLLLPNVQGDASIAWLVNDEPNSLRLARLSGRPLAVGKAKDGSLIFASTRFLLETACRQSSVRLTQVRDVPEWTYLRIVAGTIKGNEAMPVPAAQILTRYERVQAAVAEDYRETRPGVLTPDDYADLKAWFNQAKSGSRFSNQNRKS